MRTIIRLETGRHINRLNIAALAMFILLSAVILQIGIEKYKLDLMQDIKFQEIEQRKVERYINYMQFGVYGFRLLTTPSPLVTLFYNNTTFNNLQAFVDSGVRLKLQEPLIGATIFGKATGGYLDFSYYLVIIGSLLVTAWSFFTARNKEYLKFLVNFASPGKVYAGIIISRALLITGSLVIIMFAAFIQLQLNGIRLTAAEIWGLVLSLLTAVGVMVFLLIMGTFFGMARSGVKGGIIAAFFWLTVVLLWPEILNTTFAVKAAAGMKSRYEHEIQKIDLLMKFEKQALENTGRYEALPDKIDSDRRMGEKWWNEDFKEVEKLENQMIEKTAETAREFFLWSILNPITFYKSVNNELSSNGYNSYIGFYRESQKIQKGFLRYYLNKRFYENYAEVEPYLPAGKNIFHAQSTLPGYFGHGLLVNFLYIIIALGFSYRRFTNRLFPQPARPGDFEKVTLELRHGAHATLNVYEPEAVEQVLNPFFGHTRGFTGAITIDGESITNHPVQEMVYLPDPAMLPGELRALSIISSIAGSFPSSKQGKEEIAGRVEQLGIGKKRFKELTDAQKVELLFTAAGLTGRKMYIFNDFITRLYTCRLLYLEKIQALRKTGALIMEITSSHGMTTDSDYLVTVAAVDGVYASRVIKGYGGG